MITFDSATLIPNLLVSRLYNLFNLSCILHIFMLVFFLFLTCERLSERTKDHIGITIFTGEHAPEPPNKTVPQLHFLSKGLHIEVNWSETQKEASLYRCFTPSMIKSQWYFRLNSLSSEFLKINNGCVCETQCPLKLLFKKKKIEVPGFEFGT